jgi:RNA polymerase sigma-70 factor (ECF subfamily)
VQELMEVLAPDVVLIVDGGGLAPAVRSPVYGAEAVTRLLARANRAVEKFETSTGWINGELAGRLAFDGELGATVSLVVENGRATRIYVMRNPRKLARLDQAAELAR